MANYLTSNATNPISQRERAKVKSTEKAVDVMKLTKKQIAVTMFAVGTGVLEGLEIGRIVSAL